MIMCRQCQIPRTKMENKATSRMAVTPSMPWCFPLPKNAQNISVALYITITTERTNDLELIFTFFFSRAYLVPLVDGQKNGFA